MINVAIDGPSGAGKSTISRAIAAQLGYLYIDTGAMYRSLAYKALYSNIDIKNCHDRICEMLDGTSLDLIYKDGEQRMMLDSADVTDFIRTPAVSLGASDIAAIPAVRQWLLDLQRNLAKKNNCLMDGRDIGTSVLPDANVKIFLTASVEARAKRRFDELLAKGEKVTYDEVLSDMIVRDENDSKRECSPLKKADDAVVVDTSNLNFDESVSAIKEIIAKRTETADD